MAYQPKSYRKFVATAATATLVATAVTPAFAADFKDVTADYKDAVNYLVENNIAEGLTETKFGPEKTIKRGDAAVMIANALKLDTANAPASPFKDLNNRVKDAVNALYAAGIVGGKTKTTFEPDTSINRAEMAKILTNAYKLEAGDTKNKFTDVQVGWDKYVDALLANDITKGKTETTFAPYQEVTRGEFALFMYRAKDFLYEIPAASAVKVADDKTLEVTLKEAKEGLKAENFKVLVDGDKVAPSEVKAGDKGATYKLAIPSLDNKKGKVSVNGAEASYDFTTPKVESAVAINAKEIKLTFNKELNEAAAEKVANYKIYKGNDTEEVATANYTAELVDGKTVILTLKEGFELKNNETYRVNAKGLLTKDYKEVQEYKGTATIFVDKELPTLAETKVKGNQLSLKFNEPVKIANIKVDGKATEAGPVDSSEAGKYEVKYTLTNDQAKEGSHNVVLYGVKDAVGNETSIINTSYNVTADNSKPAVESITSVGTKTFDIKLNTAVNSFGDANVVIKKGNYTFPESQYKVDKVTDKKKPNTYRVTFEDYALTDKSNPLYGSKESSVSLSVEVKDFKGTNNVFGTNYSGNITLAKDTSAPVVQADAVNFIEGNNLVVVFNEEIVKVSDSVTVVKDGVEQKIKNVAVDSEDEKRLKIELDLAQGVKPSGTYEVVFGKGAVKDIDDNENAAVTTKVVTKAETGTLTPADTATTVEKIAGKNVVTINYGEKMADSARDLANYKIDGVPLNDSFYAGAVAVFTDSDKDTVKITLPADKHSVNNEEKQIEFSKNIKTDDGEVVQTSDEKVYKVTKKFADDKAPTLTKAEYVKAKSSDNASKAIKLTFDENVKIAGDIKDDVVVKVGSTKVEGKVTDGVHEGGTEDKGLENKELIVVLDQEVNTSQSGTVNVIAEGKDNTVMAIQDLFTNKAVAKEVTLTDSIVDSGITSSIQGKATAIDAAKEELAKLTYSAADSIDDAAKLTAAKEQVKNAEAKVDDAKAKGAAEADFGEDFAKLAAQKTEINRYEAKIAADADAKALADAKADAKTKIEAAETAVNASKTVADTKVDEAQKALDAALALNPADPNKAALETAVNDAKAVQTKVAAEVKKVADAKAAYAKATTVEDVKAEVTKAEEAAKAAAGLVK
ncbi:S-layer homology domain-containing protein [Bacillus xiapuensis]|uniref:S-layer homology domain-containing protein n=1 Tax=Bacillus xiapuensis TaxID=2014075 RepID=UPI000C232C7D|nr:S-layer homology domain-containing protein [Bacillus xiapuensis]